jgi:phosphoribosylaminoimidazolecarboxamide formyltransferase/IMP cyclohydrolase
MAIVQPGGSVQGNEVIKACYQANIPMFFSGTRHFSH